DFWDDGPGGQVELGADQRGEGRVRELAKLAGIARLAGLTAGAVAAFAAAGGSTCGRGGSDNEAPVPEAQWAFHGALHGEGGTGDGSWPERAGLSLRCHEARRPIGCVSKRAPAAARWRSRRRVNSTRGPRLSRRGGSGRTWWR